MLLALKSSRRFGFAFVSKRCRSQSLKSSLCVAGGTERVYVMHQLVNGRKGKKTLDWNRICREYMEKDTILYL